MTLAQPGLSVLGVRLPERATDDLLVGLQGGNLALVRYAPVTGTFQVMYQLVTQGRLVHLQPWVGLPAGQLGVVVAAADPDRVLFVRVSAAFPNLSLAASVLLEEDPGMLAWFGDVPGGDAWLAVTQPGVDRVAVLADRGGWGVLSVVECGDEPFAVAGADLAGDGTPEAVFAQRGRLSGDLGVLSATPDDGVGVRFAAVAGLAAGTLAACDLDGDGSHELVVADRDEPRLEFLRADGGGFTGVGSLDLALPARGLAVWSLEGGGPALLAVNPERGAAEFASLAGGLWQSHGAYFPGCRPLASAPAELNGDNLADVASVSADGTVLSVMLARPGPAFWGLPTFAMDALPGGLGHADFDGDGRADVLVASALGTGLALFPGRADGTIATTPVAIDLGFPNGRFAPLALDADAEAEIAVLDLGALAVVVLDREPGGTYREISRTPIGSYPSGAVAGDIDADGWVDVAVTTVGGADVKVLYGLGDGNFDAPVSVSYAVPAIQIRLTDLDGDRDLEIVAVDGTSRLWWRMNEGGRVFAQGQWLNAGNGAAFLAGGDLDGDLDQDLVVGCRNDRSLISYENRGAGVLVRRTGSHALDAAPSGLEIGDFDRDGRGDVVVGLRQVGRLEIYLSLVPWNQSAAVAVRSTADVLEFAVADVNADGTADLLALDGVLELGVAHLNVDPAGVALEPQVLRADCEGDRLRARLEPGPGDLWRLEARDGGPWRLLADAHGARAGRLDAEAMAWDLVLDARALENWGRVTELRLVVDRADGISESRTVEVPAACAGPAGAPAGVPRWAAAPWPNPGNPHFRAVFRLPAGGPVAVTVHDLAGRRVALLQEGELPPGDHDVAWDGRSGGLPAPAGVYLLRVSSPGGTAATRLVLVK
ncbi:MAG: VCBS repeat-containing protein [bacterium]|nr:VCBS repeat-containing protein [bacterium]